MATRLRLVQAVTSFTDEHRGERGAEPICRFLPIAPPTCYERVAQHDEAMQAKVRRVFDALRAPVFAEAIIEEDLVRLTVTLEVVQCCWKVIQAYVLPTTRGGGDNTTVPVMAKGTTDTARYYVNVRHDRPFVDTDRPAALFHCSRDRRGEDPQSCLLIRQERSAPLMADLHT